MQIWGLFLNSFILNTQTWLCTGHSPKQLSTPSNKTGEKIPVHGQPHNKLSYSKWTVLLDETVPSAVGETVNRADLCPSIELCVILCCFKPEHPSESLGKLFKKSQAVWEWALASPGNLDVPEVGSCRLLHHWCWLRMLALLLEDFELKSNFAT